MKKSTKKLSLTTETIRNLQAGELTRVVGGSISVYHPSTQLTPSTVISRNPSGGLPSGGIPSGGIVGH